MFMIQDCCVGIKTGLAFPFMLIKHVTSNTQLCYHDVHYVANTQDYPYSLLLKEPGIRSPLMHGYQIWL